MTSVSSMNAECPRCGRDILEQCVDLGLTYGDCEDIEEMDCPHCDAELRVELLAMFRVGVIGDAARDEGKG